MPHSPKFEKLMDKASSKMMSAKKGRKCATCGKVGCMGHKK